MILFILPKMEQKTKLCKICGQEFKLYHNQSKYCSDVCRRKKEWNRQKKYRQTPEGKAKHLESMKRYDQKPEVKARKRVYMKRWYSSHHKPQYRKENQDKAFKIWLADGFNEIKIIRGEPILLDKLPERRDKR